jgi:hypothetical protein
MLVPNNNSGMTCQTDEKHLTIFPEYFVGVVKLAINRYSNRFIFCVFFQKSPSMFIILDIKKTCKMLRLRVFWPPRLAPYHTVVGAANGTTMVMLFVGRVMSG